MRRTVEFWRKLSLRHIYQTPLRDAGTPCMAFPFHKQNIKYKNIIIISSKNLGIWGGDTQSCSLPQKYKNISYVTSLKLRDSCMVSPCHKNIFNKFAQGYGDTLQGFPLPQKRGYGDTLRGKYEIQKYLRRVFSGIWGQTAGLLLPQEISHFPPHFNTARPSFLSTFS